jgi:ABC-type sugar transport system permease subunit
MTAEVAVEDRRSPGRQARGRRLSATSVLPYWLILPTLAYLALFFAWPMYRAFELAFRDGDSGDMGRLGALLIAETMEVMRVWSKAWFSVHSK